MARSASSFPRGLVLGLTMAEVVLLIIFVLLLALAAMLHRETEERRAAEETAEEAQEDLLVLEFQVEEFESFVEEWGLEDEWAAVWAEAAPDSEDREAARTARLEVERQSEYWVELVRAVGSPEFDSPEEFITDLTDAVEREEVRAALEVSDEALTAVAAAVSQATAAGLSPEELLEAARAVAEAAETLPGRDLSVAEIVEAARIADAAREALRARGAEATPEAVEALVRDAERWRERAGQSLDRLAADLERAEEQVERLRAQTRSLAGRGGTDHPSCVYRDGDRPAYLFDVGLVESGYLLRPSEVALDPPANLRPLRSSLVPSSRPLGVSEFAEHTQAIFDWSRGEECRFFVRVFDHTPPDQKARYKELMQTLEGRFYKYAGAAGESPFAPTDDSFDSNGADRTRR